jgi:hypothetical protein
MSHEPEHRAEVELPVPSQWPAILALGVMLLMFGVVTSYVFSAVGAVLMVWSIAGWVEELRHARHE